ncbi:MAG TPA: ABC transporter ATP-binding protein [Aggregatilineales bacterium]|nr:ABC transporter ATP-binding protein [Aggregatilineales bacterium]
MAFLELTNLRKQFGSSWAVDTFNLNIDQGEFISFLGPSGCGKTTTLRMVAGFEKPTSGQIVIYGTDVTNAPANKRKIGMVFQSYALFPNMTVAENIQFGLKVAGQSREVMQQRVTEMLELIHLPETAKRYPHQLSGGQQQRVALARALAFEPQVLLLDEPLSALDAKIRVTLRQEIRSIQRKLGITAIYVTHDQEEALSISDRVVVMNKGKAEQIGTPTQIYNTPQTQFVASFVGTLNVLQAKMVDLANKVLAVDDQHVRVEQITIPVNGKPVSMALRPEAITLHRQSANGKTIPPDSNALQGTVEDVNFLGSVVRIRIRLRDQVVNADSFNNPHAELPAYGEAVTLSFPSEACRVIG